MTFSFEGAFGLLECKHCAVQVEVVSPELYMYDGECLAKAEELGKPGLVTIKQRQVTTVCARACMHEQACRPGGKSSCLTYSTQPAYLPRPT
jgi:hypothetical protein